MKEFLDSGQRRLSALAYIELRSSSTVVKIDLSYIEKSFFFSCLAMLSQIDWGVL